MHSGAHSRETAIKYFTSKGGGERGALSSKYGISDLLVTTQLTFTYSTSTIETQEKGVKYFQSQQ